MSEEVPEFPSSRKKYPRRLIRWGLFLVPWLPLLLLTAAVRVYLQPPQYRYVRVGELGGNPVTDRAAPSLPILQDLDPHVSFVPKRVTFRSIALVCSTSAFLVGYVLLLVDVSRIIRHENTPPEAS